MHTNYKGLEVVHRGRFKSQQALVLCVETRKSYEEDLEDFQLYVH